MLTNSKQVFGETMAEKVNEIKVVRGYSLTRANVEWLRVRALALSTAEKRLSDSLFLDNLITRTRAEEARGKRIPLPTPLPRTPAATAASPQVGGVKEKAR